MRPLGLGVADDALIHVPHGHRATSPAPLAVMFHGAGGGAPHGAELLVPFAEERGVIVLAPASRGRTWDVIEGGYGPDVALIDRALARTFDEYAIDPARLAVGGFSDGASYALSLGVTNGTLFSHVLAFSPGFVAPAAREGRPRLYVSQGIRDRVLPIDRCSRRIVPELQRARYEVVYREFDGPHTVPATITQEALDWFLGS